MIAPSYLLDTNICILLLAGASPPARARMESLPVGATVTSAIVYAEVMYGIDRNDASLVRRVDAFFRIAPALPFDAAAAIAYARLPFRRGSFDRLIAAHAIALGLTLVTANTTDFAGIAGLAVEDWTRA